MLDRLCYNSGMAKRSSKQKATQDLTRPVLDQVVPAAEPTKELEKPVGPGRTGPPLPWDDWEGLREEGPERPNSLASSERKSRPMAPLLDGKRRSDGAC